MLFGGAILIAVRDCLFEALEERLRGRAVAEILLVLAGRRLDTALLLLDVRHPGG